MLQYPLPFSALLLALNSAYAAAFIFQPVRQTGDRRYGKVLLFAELGVVVNEEFNPKEVFPRADFENFKLMPHRPLGMRIEESLADSNYVFVTRVEEGGLASQAGIQVGDVLVGVTGLFGGMSCSIGLGVERIKGIVASRPEDEPLELLVARGTDVLDEHEKVVIEICSNGSTDMEIEQCVIDYLSLGENYDEEPKAKSDSDENEAASDDDSDPLDNIFNMWAEDLPGASQSQTSEKLPSEQAAAPVKPWSSRSSPSGTFVRDPVTGKMKNLDA